MIGETLTARWVSHGAVELRGVVGMEVSKGTAMRARQFSGEAVRSSAQRHCAKCEPSVRLSAAATVLLVALAPSTAHGRI